MAIVLKVPMVKADPPIERASAPPVREPVSARKPNQWERGASLQRVSKTS
jgi:hypothetical protein